MEALQGQKGFSPARLGRLLSELTNIPINRHYLLPSRPYKGQGLSLLLKTKIGASDLIFAIQSPSDPSKPEANTKQEEALGKPDCVCGARNQTKICKTQIPAKQQTCPLLVTHFITDMLNCKGFLEQIFDLPPLPLQNCRRKTLATALCKSQSCRTGCFHRNTFFPSHLSISGEESSVRRARGTALLLGRGLHKPYSQSAQVFSLSSFVLNSVFRTSPKLQSNHNLKGQIDLLLHQSCNQTVVSYKER